MQSSIDSKIRKSFTGKEFDDDGASGDDDNGMNLYYFGKRYYDPEICRWISTDPQKEFHDSYRYTTNPINYFDRDGSVEGTLLPGETNPFVMTPEDVKKGALIGAGIYTGYYAVTWGGYSFSVICFKLGLFQIIAVSLGVYDPETKPPEEPTLGEEPEATVENPDETTVEPTETPKEVILPQPPPPGKKDDDDDDTPSGTVTIDTSDMSKEAQEAYDE